ncbi:uncharacterized protein BXIN_2316 [Babesia sp. Xinjiang]|uniref:uncharacterized protein n=1 Tax=Babesia sp. Xinjiang TaxID=462227 RepID=UPI000A262399|nr:uncharacterized protein BXIN_2316 [Babesia sp. Xinjiang]ORM40747.1 hypothetical protein BXIN_2316 [Babesia sp. Xinjiang]
MKRVYLLSGVSALLAARGAAALHAVNDGFSLPHNTDLQFSHMGKIFGPYSEPQANDAGKSPENLESTTTPGAIESKGTKDDIQGGSERSMDNVPVADLKKADSNGGSTTNNANTNNTANTTNTNSTHSDNNSKLDQSQSYHSEVKHGNSSYTGDTSTNVTNNFFNPPIRDAAWDGYPREARLELQYLWKRINLIDDKLGNLVPLAGGDPRLNPNNRKGLIITFDAQSDPESPTVSLDDRKGDDYF